MPIVENTVVESEHKFWLFFDSQSSYAIDDNTLDEYVIDYTWPEGNYPVPEKIGEKNRRDNTNNLNNRNARK